MGAGPPPRELFVTTYSFLVSDSLLFNLSSAYLKMATGSSAILAGLANRRSYYALCSLSPISEAKIRAIMGDIMLKTPSAFNSQSSRIVVLLKKEHENFWEIVKEVLLNLIGPELFVKTGPKLDSFKGGYGTILFYEDQHVITDMKSRFPIFADNFDAWSEHTSGMHQLMAWIALEAEGFGANLQHYNPVIDKKVGDVFGILPTWKLRAQLVFGLPTECTPPVKEKKALDELMRILGSEE